MLIVFSSHKGSELSKSTQTKKNKKHIGKPKLGYVPFVWSCHKQSLAFIAQPLPTSHFPSQVWIS